MTTTVVKSIGTAGRDYSTIAAWIAACPANLVTTDQIWQGQCYNDSEFLLTGAVSITGITMDATRYAELTTGPGQSFADHASKTTNPLAYDQSKGVGVRTTTAYTGVIAADSNSRINKLQVSCDVSPHSGASTIFSIATTTIFDQLIIEGQGLSVAHMQLGGTLKNSLVVLRGNSNQTAVVLGLGASAHSVTAVCPSDMVGSSTGFTRASGGGSVTNCATFGFTVDWNGALSADYCASDTTSPGTHNVNGLTYANQFQVITDAARDFRVKSGNGLQVGLVDIATDIIGQTRDLSNPTIGCWEYISAAPPAAFMPAVGGTALPNMMVSH